MSTPSDSRPFYVFGMKAVGVLSGIAVVPAVAAAFAGRWIDATYDIRPFGSVAVIVPAFALTAFGIMRKAKELGAEYKQLINEHRPPKPPTPTSL
jgi:hypothetical protein